MIVESGTRYCDGVLNTAFIRDHFFLSYLNYIPLGNPCYRSAGTSETNINKICNCLIVVRNVFAFSDDICVGGGGSNTCRLFSEKTLACTFVRIVTCKNMNADSLACEYNYHFMVNQLSKMHMDLMLVMT